nr:DUF2927 domain-containing protein [Jannaschia sp. Os4]
MLAALLAVPAHAQEFVEVDRRLTDAEFHRLVACGARPGLGCTKPFVRWPDAARDPLTVGFAEGLDMLRDYQRALFEAGLSRVVEEVNGVGAGIRLRRDDDAPDVAIHVVPTPPGLEIAGTGVEALDGRPLPLALVAVRRSRDAPDLIAEADIAISRHIRRREIGPVLLEEVVQALGLLTDVAGAVYHRSVFYESGNSVPFLRGQDAAALRLHYPPEG